VFPVNRGKKITKAGLVCKWFVCLFEYGKGFGEYQTPVGFPKAGVLDMDSASPLKCFIYYRSIKY
jgi:hypothetical protein